MRVAIVIYEGFTSLDATGPFEVLDRLPDVDIRFVSVDGGTVSADHPSFALPTVRLSDFRTPDITVVAGGSATHHQMDNESLLAWLREAHNSARWTTSVCTGALLLGAAGLLEGKAATTHWYELESLRVFGAIPKSERVVIEDRIITCAGVSAGIDMALRLCAELEGEEYAQAVQLGIEYAPEPPFSSGTVATAPPPVLESVTAVFREHYGPAWGDRVSEGEVGQKPAAGAGE